MPWVPCSILKGTGCQCLSNGTLPIWKIYHGWDGDVARAEKGEEELAKSMKVLVISVKEQACCCRFTPKTKSANLL